MSETPEPDTPRDDPDLEAALRDPAFDDAAAAEATGPGAETPPPGAVPAGPADDPARPEDFPHEPGAPHVGLDEDQLEQG